MLGTQEWPIRCDTDVQVTYGKGYHSHIYIHYCELLWTNAAAAFNTHCSSLSLPQWLQGGWK